eukprot:1335731-Amorphochlora_amoeboformis.AAC.2
MADEKDPSGVETSTHFKFWIFSQAQIAGKRKDLNDAVKQRLKSYAAKSGKKPKPALTLDEAMDHEPTRMMPAMIYLATKTEEANIKSEHLAKLFHCKIAHIIDQEVPVLEGLNFHLKILHPRRPLQSNASHLHAVSMQSEAKFNMTFLADSHWLHFPVYKDKPKSQVIDRLVITRLAQGVGVGLQGYGQSWGVENVHELP